MVQERKPLDANAFAVMIVLTALWGFQQVAIIVVIADVSLLMQAAIRSMLATVLLLVWARMRKIPLFERDGTLRAGLAAGILFGGQFLFLYAGLAYTSASRMIVFVYLTPALTAFGLHFLVRGERLRPVQWMGVLLAFAGLVVAFSESFYSSHDTLIGDLCGVIAAVLWSSTTVLIRASNLARAKATKTLFYQLAVSVVMLLLGSFALGEKGIVALTPLAIASLAYQGIVIAFGSYLAWFWFLTRYLAAPLSVLSFLTPMFGVLFGVWLLDEPLSGYFAVAAALIAAGIVLVNLRR
jgi:drug/metabolite transporter (DMT)-like permease